MRSQDRVDALGEVFTPRGLVLQMIRRIPEAYWSDPTKTFADITGCGNGAFLAPVVYLRVKVGGLTPLQAIQTTYGVDVMQDNVDDCREQILRYAEKASGQTRTDEWVQAVTRNVVRADSLSYDMEFDGSGS